MNDQDLANGETTIDYGNVMRDFSFISVMFRARILFSHLAVRR